MADMQSLLARRERLFGPHMTTFYDAPLHLVRGEGAWLWDDAGNRYLDAYNNVAHVGHAHPRVVAAMAEQAGRLNTHSRYLHEGVLDYGERLVASHDPGLETLLLTCTGSEANDVALRMARAATGKCGFIATDNTYHGNTALVSQLNARRPPIGGYSQNVKLVPAPDSGIDGREFARHVARAIDTFEEEGHGFAALILDPFFANEGFPDLPPDFLAPVMQVVSRARGLVIADEVQPGFGRTGSHFWGYQRAGIRPDIVTMGKPMGNGYPVAGVGARAPIMASFREGSGYFNTFAASPVAAATGMAVLDVLADEGLMENARQQGEFLRAGLAALDHPRLGPARGAGLFVGAPMTGPDAGTLADRVVEGMRARGVLIGRTGREGEVIKIRPPMCLNREQAELLLHTLGQVLAELPG